jgi:hypothetical protein
MTRFARILVALTSSLVFTPFAHAQTPSAAGHWDGAIHAPFGDVVVALDLAVEGGVLQGRFSNPSEEINGLPLARVIADGRSLELQIKVDPPQTFRGTLSSDGQAISGDFLINVYAVPFDLKRTGEAKFEAAPISPRIDHALEGTWRGELRGEGATESLVLTMANRDAQSATGTWGSTESVRIPVIIASDGSRLTITSNVTRETFTGTIDAEGGQIVGTFSEGARQLPLTFRKAR